MISAAVNRVNDLKRELAIAENAVIEATRAQERLCSTRPCPEDGTSLNIGPLPDKEGPQGARTNTAECEKCGRLWSVHIVYSGGDRLEPKSYFCDFDHRGYIWDDAPVSKLTNEQLQLSKDHIAQLGEAAIPAQRDRLNALIHEEILRLDARKLDMIQSQNASIIELLKQAIFKDGN